MFKNLASISNRRDIVAFAALAVMVIWFCDEMIFSAKIPFFRDLVSYFYPIKFSVAEAFKAGELPLWDRHMAAGFPIMAGFQSAVFYPPSVVFDLLPFFAAVRFTFVFHYAVAASGSYVLIRSWKYPIYVSLIGALLFSFGGTTVSLTNLLNHFQGAVWLPWSIYFWERAIRIRRWSAVAHFSLVALCQLLAGSPEIFLLSIGLVVLDTIRLSGKEGFSGLSGNIARLSLAGLIVVGLGMVQLLPTVELILNSRRDQPIPVSEALAWSMRPSSLIGILLPTLEADSSTYLGARLLFAEGAPFLLTSYMGVIAIFGLCAWFGASRMKDRVVLAGLFVLSLLCALGSYTPIYPFLYTWLPLLRVIRFPEKFYYATYALLIFATVRGLAAFGDRELVRVTRCVAAAIPLAWIIVYITFRWDPYLLARWIPPYHADRASVTIDPTTIAAILFSLEKQIAVSTLIAAIFLLAQLQLLREALWQSLLILVVFADLSIANKQLHFLRKTDVVQNAVRLLEKPPADHGRIFYYPPGNNLHPSFVTVTGNPTYEKGTEIALNNLLPNAGMLYGFEYFQDIDALGRRSYTDFLNFINTLAPDQRVRLLRALNVKYVVAFHPLEGKGLKLFREFPEHYSQLFEVTGGVPRAYVAARAIFDPDPLSTLRRVASETFEPLHDVVVNAATQSGARTSFQGDATINLYQNNKVQIDARLNEAGILVLTDAFYPGWRVFVDGNERKILRANYLFRGVEVAAGHHKVEFDYDPVSFKIGLVVSSLTAALLTAVPLIGLIRRRAFRRYGTRSRHRRCPL